MKLINNSTRNYVAFNTVLVAGQTVEATGKTAEILLKQPGVEKYINAKEVEALEAENELNKLKVQAMELGIKVAKKDTIESLTAKIEKALNKVENNNKENEKIDSEAVNEEENKLEKAE